MTEIFTDIGKIYKRVFDHKPFISSELNLVVSEFEEKRGDQEVENLIQSLQITSELKSSGVEKCSKLIDQNLADLNDDLNLALKACEELVNREPDPLIYQVLEKNRDTRQRIWEDFTDDMRHKRQRIDITFEEKEEELCEFYSDLERKLHIHKVRIEPSKKLVDFIKTLDEYEELSENVMHIYNSHPSKKNKKLFETEIKTIFLNNKDLEYLKELKVNEHDLQKALLSLNIHYDDEIEDIGHEESKEAKPNKKQIFLTLTDLKFLNKILTEKREHSENVPYLHELLENSKIILPQNEVIPRNPELEARCKKLREEQQNREYRSMTKDVDSVRRHMPEDTIAYQIKSINSQMIAVAQFIFSVVAGFAFGFLGVELIVGGLDFGFRLLLGIICALTIALAEIYFLAKKLNEIEDTVEFEKNYVPKPKTKASPESLGKTSTKPHKD